MRHLGSNTKLLQSTLSRSQFCPRPIASSRLPSFCRYESSQLPLPIVTELHGSDQLPDGPRPPSNAKCTANKVKFPTRPEVKRQDPPQQTTPKSRPAFGRNVVLGDVHLVDLARQTWSPAIPLPDLSQLSQAELRSRLEQASSRQELSQATAIAHELICNRLREPDTEMFLALIMANASPQGSVGRVAHLLSQMDQQKVPVTAGICHAVLRVLAVHPDYILRNDILQYMERRWFGLRDDGHQMVVASMFRERQVEKALEEMRIMRQNHLPIQPWLYAMAITILVQMQQFDEALRLLRMRLLEHGPKHMNALWTYTLDAAAQNHHYMACRYIWLRCVKPEFINASAGTCLLVMTVAARNGDVELANDVFRIVQHYHKGVTASHYELLIEAHATAGDIDSALDTMVEMSQQGHHVDAASSRPILALLKTIPDDERPVRYLFDCLVTNHGQAGRLVPTACLNVLMESTDTLDVAGYMYNHLRFCCRQGPDSRTFEIMFNLAVQNSSDTWANKLATEHQAMGFAPTSYLYYGLIRTNISVARHETSVSRFEERTEHILQYYDDMRVQVLQACLHDTSMTPIMKMVYHFLHATYHDRAGEVRTALEDRGVPELALAGEKGDFEQLDKLLSLPFPREVY